jgi:hypothetical protein
MNTSQKITYLEALHQWMNIIPTEELPPLINKIIEDYRCGQLNKNATKTALQPYKASIMNWVKENQRLARLISHPDISHPDINSKQENPNS